MRTEAEIRRRIAEIAADQRFNNDTPRHVRRQMDAEMHALEWAIGEREHPPWHSTFF